MPVKKRTHLVHPGTYKLGHRSTGGRKRLPVEIRTARDESHGKMVADVIRIRDYKIWQAEAKLKDIDTTVGKRL